MLDLPTRRVPLLDLDLLRTLVAIADNGNFSSAAEEVGRTPSAVSMQVKRIEEMVQRAVFIRDSRSVRLTADGETLLEHGRRMLALNREVMTRFIDPGLVGEVRLGTPDDVAERFMADMLRRFAEAYPGIMLNITVDDTNPMMEKIAEGRLDIAVTSMHAGFKGDEMAEMIHREPMVWAMLDGGVAVERDPLPVAVWETGCVWRHAALDALEAQGRRYRIISESPHIAGKRACLLADMGVAVLPRSSVGGRIVEVDRRHGLPPLPKYKLGLVVAERGAPAVEAVRDLLLDGFHRFAQTGRS